MRVLSTFGAVVLLGACATSDTTPGAPTELRFISQPTYEVAGRPTTAPFQVAVVDAAGNVVPSASEEISLVLPSGVSFVGPLRAETVDGIATFDSVRIRTAGPAISISAVSPHFGSAMGSPVQVADGGFAGLVFASQPQGSIDGVALSNAPQVSAIDSIGNVAAAYNGQIDLDPSVSPDVVFLLGTRAVLAVNGTATFPGLSVGSPGSGYIVTARFGSISVNSAPFSAGVPSRYPALRVTAPDTLTAGVVSPVTVSIVDASGMVMPTSATAVSLRLISADGPTFSTLGGTLTATTVNGIASFNVSIDRTGVRYLLVASPSDSASGLTPGVSGAIAVTAGAPFRVVFTTEPAAQVWAGFQGTCIVTIWDAEGNIVPTTTAPISISLVVLTGAGPFTGKSTVNASLFSGSSQFSYSFATLGTYQFVASSPGLLPATSTVLSVIPPPGG